jgi:hypothetical protein
VLPEVLVAVHPSRLYCREAGKAPIFTPVQESSGESRVKRSRRREQEPTLALIPKPLHEHINSAFPANVCLVAAVLPNGFAQVSPRGSTMVYDDEQLALWERGKGSVNASLTDGTKVTIFLRKIALRESGLLPKGGIARFYGTASPQFGPGLRRNLEAAHSAGERSRSAEERVRGAHQGRARRRFGWQAARHQMTPRPGARCDRLVSPASQLVPILRRAPIPTHPTCAG